MGARAGSACLHKEKNIKKSHRLLSAIFEACSQYENLLRRALLLSYYYHRCKLNTFDVVTVVYYEIQGVLLASLLFCLGCVLTSLK